MPRRHSKLSAARIGRAERATWALDLRKAGLTFREVGRRMGVTEQRAHRIVTEELARLNAKRAESAEAVSRLELERLDALLRAVWEKAVGGDAKAISAALKIVERRAALLGLNLVRHEVKVTETHELNVTAVIDRYAAELDRQLGARPLALPGGPAGDGGGEPLDQAGADPDAEPLPGL
jgi:hypothetical protein